MVYIYIYIYIYKLGLLGDGPQFFLPESQFFMFLKLCLPVGVPVGACLPPESPHGIFLEALFACGCSRRVFPPKKLYFLNFGFIVTSEK